MSLTTSIGVSASVIFNACGQIRYGAPRICPQYHDLLQFLQLNIASIARLMSFPSRRRHPNSTDESLASEVDEISKKDRTDSRWTIVVCLSLGLSLALINSVYNNQIHRFSLDLVMGSPSVNETGEGQTVDQRTRQMNLKSSLEQVLLACHTCLNKNWHVHSPLSLFSLTLRRARTG